LSLKVSSSKHLVKAFRIAFCQKQQGLVKKIGMFLGMEKYPQPTISQIILVEQRQSNSLPFILQFADIVIFTPEIFY